MIYIGDVDPTLYQAKAPSDYDKAFQAFLGAYPAYEKTAVLDELRRREYGRLDDNGHIYLDYTGGGLHAASQVERHLTFLNSHVLGNPHSQNPASLEMTRRVEQVRHTILRHFNASPVEYVVIFTPNASGAIKLVGEAYPFTSGSRYLLTADNHNSINGLREFATAKGAAVTYIPVVPPELRLDTSTVDQALAQAAPGVPNLFAFPALGAYRQTESMPTPTSFYAYMQGHNGRTAAATRVSISLATNFADVHGFVTFVRHLLNRPAAEL